MHINYIRSFRGQGESILERWKPDWDICRPLGHMFAVLAMYMGTYPYLAGEPGTRGGFNLSRLYIPRVWQLGKVEYIFGDEMLSTRLYRNCVHCVYAYIWLVFTQYIGRLRRFRRSISFLSMECRLLTIKTQN